MKRINCFNQLLSTYFLNFNIQKWIEKIFIHFIYWFVVHISKSDFLWRLSVSDIWTGWWCHPPPSVWSLSLFHLNGILQFKSESDNLYPLSTLVSFSWLFPLVRRMPTVECWKEKYYFSIWTDIDGSEFYLMATKINSKMYHFKLARFWKMKRN